MGSGVVERSTRVPTPSLPARFSPQHTLAAPTGVPHVAAPLAPMAEKAIPFCAVTGALNWAKVPVPSCPWPLSPQHSAVPVGVSPHTWPLLAESAVKRPAVATGPGVGEQTLVKPATPPHTPTVRPSSPRLSDPQHSARPAEVSPHVNASPATREANTFEPGTGYGGSTVSPIAGLPVSPRRLKPQQKAAPAVSSAHACRIPAATVV